MGLQTQNAVLEALDFIHQYGYGAFALMRYTDYMNISTLLLRSTRPSLWSQSQKYYEAAWCKQKFIYSIHQRRWNDLFLFLHCSLLYNLDGLQHPFDGRSIFVIINYAAADALWIVVPTPLCQSQQWEIYISTFHQPMALPRSGVSYGSAPCPW